MPSQPNVSKAVVGIVLTAGLLGGCTDPQKNPQPLQPSPAPVANKGTPATTQSGETVRAADDVVIASVGGTRIYRSELEKPLLEAYGFNLLMLIIQRDMARDACLEQKYVITPADIRQEYDWTLERMFPNLRADDDREKLLDQYLAQPRAPGGTTTRTEFAIVIETNAYMRKLVGPSVNKAVTDEVLQAQFDEEYGARRQVRHIVLDNLQDAAAVQQRIAGGEDFATLARQFSRDPSARRDAGEMPPFSLKSTNLPENFKRVAFSLKVGEVSDPVQAGGGYHLLKLEKKIEPKAVKFDDVKTSLREDVEAKQVMESVKGLRNRLAQQALAQMRITEPTLKNEFDSRLGARDKMIRDREKIKEQMEKDRAKTAGPTTTPTTAPTTEPTAAPATAPTTSPVTAPTTTPVAPQPAVKPPAAEPVAPPPAATNPTATEPVATPADPATQPVARPTSAPAATPGIDPLTGKPIEAQIGKTHTGVAPVGVIRNTTGPARAATQPTTVPSTRPN